MTAEERFAIQQTIKVLRIKLAEAFGYIRPDSRGNFARTHKKEIELELDRFELFISDSSWIYKTNL